MMWVHFSLKRLNFYHEWGGGGGVGLQIDRHCDNIAFETSFPAAALNLSWIYYQVFKKSNCLQSQSQPCPGDFQ